MSAITIESDLVHYEVLGRGRPVIFVHGWLGSWRYWVNTMQYLSSKYRTYALDLWGFGDSGKDEKKYSLQSQVMLLFQFFERLGIPKAALVGHSLGAAVCLSFARQFPDRAYRMMLISPPLYDAGGLDETRPEAMIGLSGGMNTTSTQTVGMSGTVTGTGITPAVPAAPPVTSTPFPPSVVTSAAPAAPSPSVGGAISGETQPAAPIAPTTPSSSSSVSGNVPPVSAAPPTSTPAGLPPLPALREQPGTVTPANAPTYSSSSETLPRNPFRSRGETPEEILARLRARSTQTQSQVQPTPSGGTPISPATTLPNAPTSAAPPVKTGGTGSTPAVTTPTGAPPPPASPHLPAAANAPTSAAPALPSGATSGSLPLRTGDTGPTQAVPPAAGTSGDPSTRPASPVLPTGIARPIAPPPQASALPPIPAPVKAGTNPLTALLVGAKPGPLFSKHTRQDMQDVDALRTEIDKTDERALAATAQAFDSFNLALELKRVTTPTLLLHGEDDGFITPPPLELLRRIEAMKQPGHFLSLVEPGVRHFPMMEIQAKFNRLLIDFLEAPDLTNLQFKDQWKRTIR